MITQGLFYLAWLTDHRAEFEALVRDRLGVPAAAQVLWSAPRLICVAEDPGPRFRDGPGRSRPG